jgi:MA3 domain
MKKVPGVSQYWPILVSESMKIAVEAGVKEVSLVSKFLAHLIRAATLPSKAVVDGIKGVLREIPDLKVDVPKAPQHVADIIAHLLTAKPFEVVKRTPGPPARGGGRDGRGRGGRLPRGQPTVKEEIVLTPVLALSAISADLAKEEEGSESESKSSSSDNNFSAEILKAVARRDGLTGLRGFANRGGVVESELPPAPGGRSALLEALHAPANKPDWFVDSGIALAFPIESGLETGIEKAMAENPAGMLEWIEENVRPEETIQDPAFLRLLVRCGLRACVTVEHLQTSEDYSPTQHLTNAAGMVPWQRLIHELALTSPDDEEEILDETLNFCTEILRQAGKPDVGFELFSEVLHQLILSKSVDGEAEPLGISAPNILGWWAEAKQAKNIEFWTQVDVWSQQFDDSNDGEAESGKGEEED